MDTVEVLLKDAFDRRSGLLDVDQDHTTAVRLFDGFREGMLGVVLEIYARTLVIHRYGLQVDHELLQVLRDLALQKFTWLDCVLFKDHTSDDPDARNGRVIWGSGEPAQKIRENGAWFALELTLNRDTGFYLDTRLLRARLIASSLGQFVLNTFAYTGSLGVAARVGGAQQVLQTDRNARFLNVAKSSYALNGINVPKGEFAAVDFWVEVGQLKKRGTLFDTVIVDPPFFSVTDAGRVDLVAQAERVINKVRPLVGDGGRLITINNALYVSGEDYMRQMEALCAGGYMAIEEIIPVPADCAPEGQAALLPANPAPFNHPTKIIILRVKRKDQRRASDI